jgi:hypothetical protein
MAVTVPIETRYLVGNQWVLYDGSNPIPPSTAP